MLTNKKRAIQKTSGLKTAPPGHHVTRRDRQIDAKDRAAAQYGDYTLAPSFKGCRGPGFTTPW